MVWWRAVHLPPLDRIYRHGTGDEGVGSQGVHCLSKAAVPWYRGLICRQHRAGQTGCQVEGGP